MAVAKELDMQVGDLVRVKETHEQDPNIGIVVKRIEFGKGHTKFAKVCLTNGYIGTYRFSNLEVV